MSEKKQPVRNYAKELRRSSGLVRMSESEIDSVLRKTYPVVQRAVKALIKEGVERYIIDEMMFGNHNDYKSYKAFSTRAEKLKEANRQLAFLADPKTTVLGYRKAKEHREVRILQALNILPEYNGDKYTDRTVKKQYRKLLKNSPGLFSGVFEAYRKVQEIEPIKTLYASSQVLKAIIEVNLQPAKVTSKRNNLRLMYPNIPNPEFNHLLKQVKGYSFKEKAGILKAFDEYYSK